MYVYVYVYLSIYTRPSYQNPLVQVVCWNSPRLTGTVSQSFGQQCMICLGLICSRLAHGRKDLQGALGIWGCPFVVLVPGEPLAKVIDVHSQYSSNFQ